MRDLVDPTKSAFENRKWKVKVDCEDILLKCVDFAGTMQEVDILKRTDMPVDKRTGKYPYRFKIDNKILDTEERARNGLRPFDFSDEITVIKKLGEKYNFDVTLCALRKSGDSITKLPDYDRPLIFQGKGCNLHDWTETGGCVYCYVDADSNNPIAFGNSVWLTVDDILDTAEALREDASIRSGKELHRIRHSGGETTTELDFTLEIAKGIEERGLEKLYLQFDTNLSTGKFIEKMIARGVYQGDILRQLAGYDVFVYAAFKGTSNQNIRNNTQAKLTVDDQIYSFGKLIDAGLDVYPCIYNPDWQHLGEFVDKLDENFTNASTRLRVEGLKWEYGPTICRLRAIADSRNMSLEEITEEYKRNEEENYNKGEELMRTHLQKSGLAYKEIDRTQYPITRA